VTSDPPDIRKLSPNCWICARVAPFWFGVLLCSSITEAKPVSVVLSLTEY